MRTTNENVAPEKSESENAGSWHTRLWRGICALARCAEKQKQKPKQNVNPKPQSTDNLPEDPFTMEDHVMPAPQPARYPLTGALLPGEHPDIRVDLKQSLANADEWLATPNSNYGGRRPLELIGTPDELLLRDTLRSVLYSGMA